MNRPARLLGIINDRGDEFTRGFLFSFIAKDKITLRVTVLRGGKLLLTDFPVQIHFRLLHNFMNKWKK